jgi:uncharacterized BrkB/YihY/UPF0761 family membrane protein
VLGLVLSGDPSARHAVLHSTFSQFPIVGHYLEGNIHALHKSSVVGLVIGLVALLYGATGLASTGQYAMAQVWNLPGPNRPNFVHRLGRSASFLGILGTGVVLTTALSGFGTFGRHHLYLGVLSEVLAIAGNAGVSFAVFRVLTPKAIDTRSLVPGAVSLGVVWTGLQAVGGYVIGHDLKGASATYGLFAIVLGLLAWIYLGARMTVYAAELNTVLKRHLWPRSLVQPPLTDADRTSLSLQVTQNQRRPEQSVESRFADEANDDSGPHAAPPGPSSSASGA